MPTKHVSNGFTLIELTIVLIIIGLLLGIVFKGADVLRSAYMKKDYANYVDRLYGDVYKYKSWTLARLGYENIIADGTENGGYDESTDGFIDTDTDNKTVGTWFDDVNASDVRLLTDYDGSDKPYAQNNDNIIAYLSGDEVDPDIASVFQLGSGTEGFMFHTKGSKVKKLVHIYLGADRDGAKTANFLVIDDLPIDEGISFDTMIDGSADGEEGKFIVLGFETDQDCYKNINTDHCQCDDGQFSCIGKGAEGGCAFPACAADQVQRLVVGYSLKD